MNSIVLLETFQAVIITLIIVFFLMFVTSLPELFIREVSKKDWAVSPYPNGYDFAFTIISDCDNSYSKRLFPLFEVFDKLGFKLTITVFVFWSEKDRSEKVWIRWEKIRDKNEAFFIPRSVPLEDENEKKFYLKLVSHGHEVGIHTPTDTSDKRQELLRAFEFYKTAFLGYYPKIYIEHRNRDNLECHQREGANPESEYFVTDILNHYGPWVWVIGPSAIPYEGRGKYYNILSKSHSIFNKSVIRFWGILKKFIKTGKWNPKNGEEYLLSIKNGSPFDQLALKKYGLIKAFRRTGKKENAHGTGFLEWYSKKNIDRLEKDGGLALVYTHFDTLWIDKDTKRMRKEIENCLEYIASKNVWLATASDILDRFKDIENIHIAYDDKWLKIVNANPHEIKGLTIISNTNNYLYYKDKKIKRCKNKIVIGNINPLETLVFEIRN